MPKHSATWSCVQSELPVSSYPNTRASNHYFIISSDIINIIASMSDYTCTLNVMKCEGRC
jgi:hypothetical protein